MARLILDIDNPANWLPVWSYRLTSSQVYGLNARIPDQIVPVLVDSPVLTLKSSSLAGMPTWKHGGWVTPYLQTGNQTIGEIATQQERLLLGSTKFMNLGRMGNYKLKVSPAKWLPSFELDILAYSGPFTDTGEFPQGRVRSVTPYTPNTSPVLAVPKNENRVSATLFNSSTAIIYIGFESDVSPSTAVETLYPGGQWISDGGDLGDIWFISDVVSATRLSIVEYRTE
jgi:hypothetical protein